MGSQVSSIEAFQQRENHVTVQTRNASNRLNSKPQTLFSLWNCGETPEPMSSYDVIVLGVGGVGSATLWQLARRGLRVLGIDRFVPPHDRGSSHGQTRIIRQAYFEHPDYVPLLVESYRLWEELEGRTAQSLKVECGLLEVGPANGMVVPGVLRAAAVHELDILQLDAGAIEQRWPAFRVSADLMGVYESRGGYLHVERCVEACLAVAAQSGAKLLTGVTVRGWSAGNDVTVHTAAGDFRCGRLVVTAGAWAGPLLGTCGVPLAVKRKPLMWHRCRDESTSVRTGFPCFLFELPSGVFYGFPAIDSRGVKAAEHSGGDLVGDPLSVDRCLHPHDSAAVCQFLRSHLPAVHTPCTEHAVCLYTMSLDEHFVVDRHPEDGRIVFAAGLSGHGFKFTPALGKALAELAVDGRSALPIDFLSIKRVH